MPAGSPSFSTSLSRLFDALAGSDVVVVHELSGPTPSSAPADLHPDERAQIEGSAPGRQRQYTAGRRCARAGLRHLSLPDGAILSAPDRSPRWPDGADGSITHTGDVFAAAAVARREVLGARGIGLDAEQTGRVTRRLYDRVFTAEERERLAALQAGKEVVASTVMFSVKEAFYKAQFGATAAWVGFQDVEVHSPDDWSSDATGSGLVRLTPATDLAALDRVTWPVEGRFELRPELVTTAVVARFSG